MENLLILLAITILQEVFLWITPDHNIAKRFVQTLKSTSHCVIFRSAHYNFPVLTLKVLQIFSRIQTFVNLSNQKAVTIIEFFVVLNWSISFGQINNAVLWKIFLIDAKITRLLLKKTLVRPYINGISFKANFFSSYCCFNPAIRKNISCFNPLWPEKYHCQFHQIENVVQLNIRPEKYQTKYQKASQRASRTNQTRQKKRFFFTCRPIVLFKKFKIIFPEHPGFLLGWIAGISRLWDAVKIPYWDFWADVPSFFLVEIIQLLRSRSL